MPNTVGQNWTQCDAAEGLSLGPSSDSESDFFFFLEGGGLLKNGVCEKV